MLRILPQSFGLILLLAAAALPQTRYIGKARWLGNAKAVVTHTIDDTTKFVPDAVDAMDRHGIKATIYLNTASKTIAELWPRMRAAVANGHEIGSHSRTHPCKWPDTEEFCAAAYTDAEISGSRDDILQNTPQPHVWSWCYPCGNCARYPFIQKRIEAAGYLLARNYRDEANNGHLVPDLNTFAPNPFDAAYTQVVQKKGGIAPTGNDQLPQLNAKFDQVYAVGGIYNFMSHPQWLDYGPEAFYEAHLRHIGNRIDIWYVPLGPLYAYRTLRDSLEVKPQGKRFQLRTALNRKIYNGSVTLEFISTGKPHLDGAPLPERPLSALRQWNGAFYTRAANRLWVTVPPAGTLEFR
ncbi:MAG: polysaccharide deacetylase family protein [Bryobacterales bacterium]|nr:polysaccharide deacetylase family protein [Bryobacterales bacterium]